MALHHIDLVGKDVEAQYFRQCAWVVQTFQRLGQCKVKSGILCEETHIVVVHLYSFNRCCRSEMDRPVVDGSIPTLGPYKVSIPVRFLITDVGECDEMGAVVNLEGGMSRVLRSCGPNVRLVQMTEAST